MSTLTTTRIREHALKLGMTHLTDTISELVARAEADKMGYLDFVDNPHLFPLVATRPPVGPAAASQPALDRVLPFRAERRGLLRRHCRLCLPRVHQLPARHLLWWVAAHGSDISTADASKAIPGQPADLLAQYPTLRRLRPELAQDNSREEFEHSLANLMRRLEDAVAKDEHYQQAGATRRQAVSDGGG